MRSARASIANALSEVRFEQNELVYLALTSKPEQHVRDRLAWRLQCAFPRLLVAREWRRCDLALLDGGVPLAVIEAKATGTGNVSWGLAGPQGVRASFAALHGAATYLEALLRADAQKMAALAPEADRFVLLLVTHIADRVPPELDSVVKYGRQLREIADRVAAEAALHGYLKALGPVKTIRLGAGSAFGIRASVDAWLCGPVV